MKFNLLGALLLATLSAGSTFATEIQMIKLPEDVVGIETKTVKLNKVLNVKPGQFGEHSEAKKQGVNEVSLEFYKMKDGSLKAIRGFARLPKDAKGVVYSLPLNSFDDESNRQIADAYKNQYKTKLEEYDQYLIGQLIKSRQDGAKKLEEVEGRK